MKNFLSFPYESAKKSKLTRYILVGGLCALSDIALLYLLVNYVHIWYLTSSIISFVIVTAFGYFGQKYFTFRDFSKNHKKQIPVFFIVAGTGLVINTFFMFLFVSFLSIWYIIANIITKLVVLAWNFLANKHITFKSN